MPPFQPRPSMFRTHHPSSFSLWLAGGEAGQGGQTQGYSVWQVQCPAVQFTLGSGIDPRVLVTWIERRTSSWAPATEVTRKCPKTYQLDTTKIKKISLLRMTQCVILASRHALEISMCNLSLMTKRQ